MLPRQCIPPIPEHVSLRFWSHVDVRMPNECWPWKSRTNRGGYGEFKFAKQNRLSHRIAYAITHPAWDRLSLVRHTCDNPPCCNPLHLIAGSYADNAGDRDAGGRGALGERDGNARVTSVDVLAWAERRASGECLADIAADYGVSRATVGHALNGRTWCHLIGEPVMPRRRFARRGA